MDFVSNILKKTPFKAEATEEKEKTEEETSGEKERRPDSSLTGIGAGLVDGVQSYLRTTFKGNASQDSASATTGETKDSDGQEENVGESKKKESIGTGIMNTVLKTTSFFKSDSGDSRRKGSTEATSETEIRDEGSEEPVDKSTPEQVSQKAIDSAKSIGNFLFNVANKAGQTVTATASKIKQSVEHNSLLADFTKEQQEFIKEHGGNLDVGEPPWVGCEKEEEVKQQIISLSQDKRNFLRCPPVGVHFDFDMQQMLPVALALLKHDPNLETMRFELVPKLVNEEIFWRNYFYRVSLIKQSTSSIKKFGVIFYESSSSSSAEEADEPSPTNPEPEFISDSIQGSVSDEDLQSGMRQLGLGHQKSDSKADSSLDDKRWEDEINKDLQEFEVVGKDGMNRLDDDLEKALAEL